MKNFLENDGFENEKETLLRMEARYLESRSGSWHFISMVQRQGTNLRRAYTEIRESIIDYSISKTLSENEYVRNIESALDFLWQLNAELQDALGMDRNFEYFDLWQSVNFAVSDIQNIQNIYSHLPKNLNGFAPIVREYIKNKAIQCRHIDWLLMDFMAFTQLNSAVYTASFCGALETTLIEKLFFKDRARAKAELVGQLKSLTNIYLQCSEPMFNPIVIHHLAVELRRHVDFYEAIFFDLLDCQIFRGKREYHI